MDGERAAVEAALEILRPGRVSDFRAHTDLCQRCCARSVAAGDPFCPPCAWEVVSNAVLSHSEAL